MKVMKFTFDVAVRDDAPIIDVANALEKAVRTAHHDVLAVELHFGYVDEPSKAPVASKGKRKYTRRANPADLNVSPNVVRVERRGIIPAGVNARDMEGL